MLATAQQNLYEPWKYEPHPRGIRPPVQIDSLQIHATFQYGLIL